MKSFKVLFIMLAFAFIPTKGHSLDAAGCLAVRMVFNDEWQSIKDNWKTLNLYGYNLEMNASGPNKNAIEQVQSKINTSTDRVNVANEILIEEDCNRQTAGVIEEIENLIKSKLKK